METERRCNCPLASLVLERLQPRILALCRLPPGCLPSLSILPLLTAQAVPVFLAGLTRTFGLPSSGARTPAEGGTTEPMCALLAGGT